MPFDEGCKLLEAALKIEARESLTVAHETHRMRLFYSPFPTAAYLRQVPTLRINADFSHWCVVGARIFSLSIA